MEKFFNNPWFITIFGGIISSVIGGLLLLLIRTGIVRKSYYLPDFWPGLMRFILFIIANIALNIIIFYLGKYIIIACLEPIFQAYGSSILKIPNIIFIVIYILAALFFVTWSFFRIVLDEELFDRY